MGHAGLWPYNLPHHWVFDPFAKDSLEHKCLYIPNYERLLCPLTSQFLFVLGEHFCHAIRFLYKYHESQSYRL